MTAREAECLGVEFGIERLAFLTLTFRKPVYRIAKAQAKWHDLCRRYLARHFLRMIVTWERHDSEGIHWHALVVCTADSSGKCRELPTSAGTYYVIGEALVDGVDGQDLEIKDCEPRAA